MSSPFDEDSRDVLALRDDEERYSLRPWEMAVSGVGVEGVGADGCPAARAGAES
ncbi:hypothetical protein ACIBF5_30340 [Micromonospora sp. NPDC050417]|uniref:hypothetical protein n=1 Tax=Micromonospora sp. NPDC050417 TaxID=3364280 RepID=UPI00379467A3